MTEVNLCLAQEYCVYGNLNYGCMICKELEN
jgi:hypothetical protein